VRSNDEPRVRGDMEQRLFVDVDDTLIRAVVDDGQIHPYAFWRCPYRVNEPLVEYVKQFRRDHPEALIVIWSGGGADYARAAVAALFGFDYDCAPMVKDRTTFGLVREWDIVVDDQRICTAERYELRVRAPVLHPDDPEITGECI